MSPYRYSTARASRDVDELRTPAASFDGIDLSCRAVVFYAAPSDYLDALVQARSGGN